MEQEAQAEQAVIDQQLLSITDGYEGSKQLLEEMVKLMEDILKRDAEFQQSIIQQLR